MQVVLVYLKPFRRNLLSICALQPKVEKNFTETPFLGVQGRSRSSMFTSPKSPSPVLVMICSKSVPICNRFHTIKANSGKITSFKVVPLFDALFRREPLHPGARNFVTKN